MKDRFTATLLVIVAFIGGLLAMVVVARWQTGKPEAPATQPRAMARATPEAPPESRDPLPEIPPAEESAAEPERPASEGVVPTDVGSPAVEGTVAPGTGDPEAAATGQAQRTGRTEPQHRTSVPQTQPRRDNPSSPQSGSGSAATRESGRVGGTKSSAGALPPDRSFVIDMPQQASSRTLGRQPAPDATPDSAGSGEDATYVPPELQEPDPYEPPDPVDDPPRPDDPFDEPDAEPEPEPIPPALVRASATSAVFTVDDVVPVVIEIRGGTDVGHVPFHLAFDPRVLRFESAVEGDFLRTDGSPTVFYATIAGSGDAVVVGLSRLGHGPGIDGSGTLCVLNFVAVGSGTTQLRFKLAAVKDSGNGPMPSAFESGSVSVVVSP